MKTPIKIKASTQASGFALISALSIMVLLVMLVVGMLSLATTETRSANQDKFVMEARANARMALMIALGELQEAVGPDQRVTANSDIISDTVQQQQVLGVWASISQQKDSKGGVKKVPNLTNALDLSALSDEYKASYDNGSKNKDKRFLRWLVSGDAKELSKVDYPESELKAQSGGGKVINLVGARSLGVYKTAEMLQARLIDTNDGQSNMGGYAWGVIGEGLKARVNLKHEEEDSISKQLASRAASPVTGIQALKPIAGDADVEDVGANYLIGSKVKPDLDKAVTSPSLALLGSGGIPSEQLSEQLKPYFNDISTVSKGMPINVKWGGWKKDLNLLAEMPKSSRHSTYQLASPSSAIPATKEQQIFTGPSSRSSNERTHGPVWADMLDYMNSYKIVGNADNDGHLTWHAGGVPSYSMGTNWGNVNQSRVWRSTMPVMTKSIWYLSLAKVTKGASNYVVVVVQPVVEFWNPYNVPIKIPEGLVLKLNHQELRLDIEASANGLPVVKKSLRQLFNGIDGYAVPLGGVEIPAGETVYFSDSQPRREVGRWSMFQLEPGIPDLNGGVYFIDSNSYLYKDFTGTQVNLKMPYSAGNGAWVNNNYELYQDPATSWGDFLGMVNENMVFGVFPDKTIMGQYMTSRSVNVGSTPELFFMGGIMLRDEFGADQSSPASADEISNLEKAQFPHWQFAALSSNKYTLRSDSHGRNEGKDVAMTVDLSPYTFFGRTVSGNNNNLQTRASDFSPTADAGFRGRAGGIGSSSLEMGSPNVVFRELPIQPLTSMMQLQHSDLGDRILKPSENYTVAGYRPYSENHTSFPNVNFAFGNSFDNPLVAKDQIDGYGVSPLLGNGDAFDVGYHDKSWKANEALWDQWFMSGVGEWSRKMDGGKDSTSTLVMLDDLVSGSKVAPFPYARFKGNVENSQEAQSDLFGGGKLQMDAYKNLAQYIYNEGAFNVNSTSEYAWKVMLAGADLSARDYKYLVPGMLTSSNWADDKSSTSSKYTFSRFTIAPGASTATNQVASNKNQRWLGSRSLTEDELGTLATKIVEQVKERGPFLSLSDFMNRALKSNDKGHMVRGAVQAALYESGLNQKIKDDSSPINKSLLSYGSYANRDAFGDYDKDGIPQDGFTARGAPGFLTQADILTGVAPALTVRCDTFTIRTYGESRDARGKVKAKAWAEAVVQRTPEYISSVSNGGDETDMTIIERDGSINSLSDPKNIKYGRKLELVSFKWLNSDEV